MRLTCPGSVAARVRSLRR